MSSLKATADTIEKQSMPPSLFSIPLEVPTCLLCDQPGNTPLYRFDPFAVVRCNHCGLHYLSPRPTEDSSHDIYLSSAYFDGGEIGYCRYSDQEETLRMTFRRLLWNLQDRGVTGCRLLEIGCGYGYLLSEARSFYPYRAGTEMNNNAVNRAIQYADVIYNGGIAAVPAEEKFDCIISANVIEHVYHPVEFMKKAVSHLAEDGVLVIATPWFNGPLYKITRKMWPSFKIPEHIVFFDPGSLENLFRLAGLTVQGRLPYPHWFPLAAFFDRHRLVLPTFLRRRVLRVPGTTIAIFGKRGKANRES